MASALDTVASWYSSIAGKTGDEQGMQYWSNRVANEGADAVKAVFAQNVADNTPAAAPSPAPTYYASSPSPAPSPAPANNYASQAASLYTGLLGRQGDAEGLKYWESQLASGRSLDDVTNSFKDSARTVYQDFLTNPNSVHKNAGYSGLLGSDLNGGISAGSLTGDARSVAKTGLSSDIYKNLYGTDPVKTKPVNTGVTTLDPSALTHRVINPNTETVRGQLSGLLAEDSKVLQQARADGMRTASERGLTNSAMAASAGEDALIRSAVNIATPDAGYYNKASDYNAALENQAMMYNAEAMNAAATNERGFNYQSLLQGQNNANQAGMQAAQLSQQMIIAQMNDETSRYNTDTSYRQQIDNQRYGIMAQILNTSNDLMSPDLKAQNLEALGFGKAPSRVKGSDGKWKIDAGDGMAGMAYVLEDIAKDLVVGEAGVDAALEAKDKNKDGRVTRAELLANA